MHPGLSMAAVLSISFGSSGRVLTRTMDRTRVVNIARRRPSFSHQLLRRWI